LKEASGSFNDCGKVGIQLILMVHAGSTEFRLYLKLFSDTLSPAPGMGL